jgi:hypothetical protein
MQWVNKLGVFSFKASAHDAAAPGKPVQILRLNHRGGKNGQEGLGLRPGL